MSHGAEPTVCRAAKLCLVPPPELPELLVADAAAFREWLEEHGSDPTGVWLVLAKKNRPAPTTLNYDEALDEALCQGWIDGQLRRKDEDTYLQRFTPRRARSSWSQANVTRIERLTGEGRIRPAGLAQVEAAKADGRWDAAYPGRAGTTVPADFEAALAAEPRARVAFEGLDSGNRFAILYRIRGAKRAETRQRRIDQFIAMLVRGEKLFP